MGGPRAALTHELLLGNDLVSQWLEPAKKERLDIGQVGRQLLLAHVSKQLAVLLGGLLPRLRLNLDLPPAQHRILVVPDPVHRHSLGRVLPSPGPPPMPLLPRRRSRGGDARVPAGDLPDRVVQLVDLLGGDGLGGDGGGGGREPRQRLRRRETL